MITHICKDRKGPGWYVWVSLDETLTSELYHSGESFIIAWGQTRSEAIRNGQTELANAAQKICLI